MGRSMSDADMVSGPVVNSDMKRWEKLGVGRYQDEHHWIHLRIIEVLGDDERGYLVRVYEVVEASPTMPTGFLGQPVAQSMMQADGIVFLPMTKEEIREFLL